MNNNKFNIDTYTSKLVNKGGLEQPDASFTKNVMSKILKDPSININFITRDDKQSNLWLFISVGIIIIGYLFFYFIKNGFNLSQSVSSVQMPSYLKVFMNFFENLLGELSLSPYIFLALIGVVILVIMDKTIVRYLYSI